MHCYSLPVYSKKANSSGYRNLCVFRQRFNQVETSYTELQGKHADIMAVKMKLEKNVSNLTTALDREKSSQSNATDQVEQLQGKLAVASKAILW